MFNTNEELIHAANEMVEAQPAEFQETLKFSIASINDPDVQELVNFISSKEEPQYLVITRT